MCTPDTAYQIIEAIICYLYLVLVLYNIDLLKA